MRFQAPPSSYAPGPHGSRVRRCDSECPLGAGVTTMPCCHDTPSTAGTDPVPYTVHSIQEDSVAAPHGFSPSTPQLGTGLRQPRDSGDPC